MQAKGIDPDSSTNLSAGINYAFPVVQALAIAGQLDGGLTRTNFQLALRSIDMTPPVDVRMRREVLLTFTRPASIGEPTQAVQNGDTLN